MLVLKGALLVISLEALFGYLNADVIQRGESVFLLNAHPLDSPLDRSLGHGNFLTRTTTCAPGHNSITSVSQVTQASLWKFHKHKGADNAYSIASADGKLCLRADYTVYLNTCSDVANDQRWLHECNNQIAGLCVIRQLSSRKVLGLNGDDAVLVELTAGKEEHYWKLVSSTETTIGVRSWGASNDRTENSAELCKNACRNEPTCHAVTYDNDVKKCHMHYKDFTTNSYTGFRNRWISWFKSDSYSGVNACEPLLEPKENSVGEKTGEHPPIPAMITPNPALPPVLTTRSPTQLSQIIVHTLRNSPVPNESAERIADSVEITTLAEVPQQDFNSPASSYYLPTTPTTAYHSPGTTITSLPWEAWLAIAFGLLMLILIVAAVAALCCKLSRRRPKEDYAKVPLGQMMVSLQTGYPGIQSSGLYLTPVPPSPPPETPSIDFGILSLVNNILWESFMRTTAARTVTNRRTECMQQLKDMELNIDDIETGDMVATGHFSKVHEGFIRSSGEKVAIKMPKNTNDPDEYACMISEMIILKIAEGHPNILHLYGAVTSQIARGMLCLVTQFCQHGSLQQFLAHAAPIPDDPIHESEEYLPPRTPLLNQETSQPSVYLLKAHLLWFAYQVAAGLTHLHSRSIIHRDLAARNVLVAHNWILKIADFGLSRARARYTASESKVPPWPWTAVECFRSNVATAQSDMWSFGVVMWEIFSFGQSPQTVVPSPSRAIAFGNPKTLKLLPKPSGCLAFVYETMQKCWRLDPSLRPLSSHLHRDIAEVGTSEYGELFANVLLRQPQGTRDYINNKTTLNTGATAAGTTARGYAPARLNL